jgi:hypothetical protein
MFWQKKSKLEILGQMILEVLPEAIVTGVIMATVDQAFDHLWPKEAATEVKTATTTTAAQ